MSLYGRTDSNANKTKAGRAAVTDSNTRTIVFVDNTEAQLEENKSRGITSPGWWAYDTYTDMHGNTRHKCELLVFIADPDGTETQADDTIAADVASAVTITVQPANSTSSSGAGHTPLPQPPQVHLAHCHISGSVNLQVKIRTGPTSLAVLVDLIQVSPMQTSRPQLLLTVLSLATLWTALSLESRLTLRVVQKK